MGVIGVASLTGFGACVAYTVATQAGFDATWPIIALFVGVFLTSVPAIMSHPAKKMHGTHVSVSFRQTMRTAPVWLNALLIGTFAYWLLCLALNPSFFTSDGYGLEDFRGHPERYRMIAASFMVFYASSAQVAESGRAWWAKWASGQIP